MLGREGARSPACRAPAHRPAARARRRVRRYGVDAPRRARRMPRSQFGGLGEVNVWPHHHRAARSARLRSGSARPAAPKLPPSSANCRGVVERHRASNRPTGRRRRVSSRHLALRCRAMLNLARLHQRRHLVEALPDGAARSRGISSEHQRGVAPRPPAATLLALGARRRTAAPAARALRAGAAPRATRSDRGAMSHLRLPCRLARACRTQPAHRPRPAPARAPSAPPRAGSTRITLPWRTLFSDRRALAGTSGMPCAAPSAAGWARPRFPSARPAPGGTCQNRRTAAGRVEGQPDLAIAAPAAARGRPRIGRWQCRP